MAEPGLAHEAVLVAALRLGAAPLSPPRTEAVPGVPGAFLIRGALSAAEAGALAAAVAALHAGGRAAGEQPRRDSQHHVPLTAPVASLAPLCARLRAHLSPRAGPAGGCDAALDEPGRELSPFLRCYAYVAGDESKPHYDRAFREHEHEAAGQRGGRLLRFSAFSLLLYLNDGFEGGATTFFQDDPARGVSRRGATPLCDRDRLVPCAAVAPRAGDVLCFPHGAHPGCHPALLHEGSRVLRGEKMLIRTDVLYTPRPAAAPKRAPAPPPVAAAVPEADDGAAAFEAALEGALADVCPAYAALARHSVRRVGERGGADLETAVAAAVFWAAAGDGRAGESAAQRRGPASAVLLHSRLGLQRSVTRLQLAQLILDALPPLGDGGLRLASLRVAPGDSGTIQATTLGRRDEMAAAGRVACAQCGRYVMAHTGGMEWHVKTAHGVRVHAEAAAAAAAAATALVPFALPRDAPRASQAPLAASDLASAQRDAGAAARLVAAGRVKALEPGLDACRCGDLARLRRLVEQDGWAPERACDEHGSGPLLWAAGGGHLEVCQYLVDTCGIDPSVRADARLARRGYSGRTALHWAARNGHVHVLRWLVDACGCAADARTADGTTALCWAAWQGHVAAARYLVEEAGCDARTSNAFCCTPAHWAAQGGCLPVCEYLHALGVSFSDLNSQHQGCLHKAAQRGHAHVCDWLLGPDVALLAPANPAGGLHCGGNKNEGACPSELARCGGHHQLARRLADAEAAWLASR